jgi:hypothetical protein
MAPHDPLFKSLLRTFFAGFLRLVAPEMAERLDLSAPVFLDKELTAFDPPARSRLVDLLARIPLKGAPGRNLLIHTEVESRARRGMGERIRSYQRWIQTHHDGQILSIVLFLHGGRAGVCEETIDGELAGPGLPAFRYLSFGLSRCRAVEYLEKPEPLAWALAALMDRRPWSRAELKMRCLARIREAPLSQAERRELVNCVETYLQLTSSEAGEFSSPGNLGSGRTQNMAQSLLFRMSWADTMMGEGARQVVLGVLEQRFGPVPDEIRQRVEKIRSVDRLTRLAQKVLTAKSLKSLRLG